MSKVLLRLRVNGDVRTVAAEPHHTLLEVLREECGLTGTKHGCELGECGACTVLVDGVPMLSCLTLPLQIGDAEVTTVEGLARGSELHPLQVAFAEEGAAQCGYCTPGILMAAKALLDREPRPTREAVAEAISGNLCRCTGYTAIYEAVEKAAERAAAGETGPQPARVDLESVLRAESGAQAKRTDTR
jgi:aerobic-type carbon monoxide dehydrogenase small subunit (CoxS/CutS family)